MQKIYLRLIKHIGRSSKTTKYRKKVWCFFHKPGKPLMLLPQLNCLAFHQLSACRDPHFSQAGKPFPPRGTPPAHWGCWESALWAPHCKAFWPLRSFEHLFEKERKAQEKKSILVMLYYEAQSGIYMELPQDGTNMLLIKKTLMSSA